MRMKTKFIGVLKRVRELKQTWAGHVCRLNEMRGTKKAIEWIPFDKKRKKGRQRKSSATCLRGLGSGWMTIATVVLDTFGGNLPLEATTQILDHYFYALLILTSFIEVKGFVFLLTL